MQMEIKRVEVISDKIDFKWKTEKKDEEGYYIMINESTSKGHNNCKHYMWPINRWKKFIITGH